VFTAIAWALALTILVKIALGVGIFQWDIQVYHSAPNVLETGDSPYYQSTVATVVPKGLSFLYPPITLYAFKPLANLSYEHAHTAWFLAKLAALGLLLLLWHKQFERLNASWTMVFFFMLAFNATLLRDLTAGNISIFEQLAIWTAFCLLIRGRPYEAGALLAVLAQFKLMPVVFLGLLLVIGPPGRWKPFVTSVTIFLILLGLNYVLMPTLTTDYVASFFSANPNIDERGDINPSSLALIRTIFDWLSHHGFVGASGLANVVYALYVTVVGAAVLWFAIIHRSRLSSLDPVLLIYCACVLFVLVMPRVKDYTYILLLMPALFVLRRSEFGPHVPLLGFFVLLPASASYVPVVRGIPLLQAYSAFFTAIMIMLLLLNRLFPMQLERQSQSSRT